MASTRRRPIVTFPIRIFFRTAQASRKFYAIRRCSLKNLCQITHHRFKQSHNNEIYPSIAIHPPNLFTQISHFHLHSLFLNRQWESWAIPFFHIQKRIFKEFTFELIAQYSHPNACHFYATASIHKTHLLISINWISMHFSTNLVANYSPCLLRLHANLLLVTPKLLCSK